MPRLDEINVKVNVDADDAKAELDELQEKVEALNDEIDELHEKLAGEFEVTAAKNETVNDYLATDKMDVQIPPRLKPPATLGHPMYGCEIAETPDEDPRDERKEKSEFEDRWRNTLYNE